MSVEGGQERRVVVGVPGIHSKGKANIDRGLEHMQRNFPLRPRDPDLALRWAITAWFYVNQDAREVADVTRHGDALFCHSYGCLRGTRAAEMIYQEQRDVVSLLFLIAPAMSVNYDFSKLSPKTRVVALVSKHDTAIKWGSRIPMHPFGDAGRKGFSDPRVRKIDVSHKRFDHDDYFNNEEIPWLCDLFYAQLLHSV